jgi:hypothetical protein
MPSTIGDQISSFVHDFFGTSPGPPGEPPGPAISEFVIAHTPPNPVRPPSPGFETNPAVPILDVQFGDTGDVVRGTHPHFEDFFPPGIATATAELPAVQLPRELPPNPILPPSPVFETNPAVPILHVLFGDPGGLPGGTAVVGLAASDDWLVV